MPSNKLSDCPCWLVHLLLSIVLVGCNADKDKQPGAPGIEAAISGDKGETKIVELGELSNEENALMSDREMILAFKKLRGAELQQQYGAHGLGIGWQRVDGVKTDKLALVFYVSSATSKAASSIPASFIFRPGGDSGRVDIPTTVIESPRAQEESVE